MDKQIKTVCAWCGRLIHEGRILEDGSLSHGICPDCFKKEMEELTKGDDFQCVT